MVKKQICFPGASKHLRKEAALYVSVWAMHWLLKWIKSFTCVKWIIMWLPLGVETGLRLSEPVGEIQTGPLNSCSSSLGDCGNLPFSVMLLDAEVGIFETRLCTPQIVSKSGLVVNKRKGRRDRTTLEMKLIVVRVTNTIKNLLNEEPYITTCKGQCL